jgi:hypothetical protein
MPALRKSTIVALAIAAVLVALAFASARAGSASAAAGGVGAFPPGACMDTFAGQVFIGQGAEVIAQDESVIVALCMADGTPTGELVRLVSFNCRQTLTPSGRYIRVCTKER